MTMLPFDPNAIYYLWFLKWREHVRAAKSCKMNNAFCAAAAIANMEYVLHLAAETVRLKKAGVIKDD